MANASTTIDSWEAVAFSSNTIPRRRFEVELTSRCLIEIGNVDELVRFILLILLLIELHKGEGTILWNVVGCEWLFLSMEIMIQVQ